MHGRREGLSVGCDHPRLPWTGREDLEHKVLGSAVIFTPWLCPLWAQGRVGEDPFHASAHVVGIVRRAKPLSR